MLVAAEADAVDAVGARAEGRGEVDGGVAVVIGTAAASGTEPELAAAGRGLDRAQVEGVVLPAAAEADTAEVATGGGEADLARRRGRGDEIGELGLRDIVTDHDAGEGVAVGLRDDLLRRDVRGGEEADHRAWVKDDVALAERRAGTGQALDRAGGVVTAVRVDIEAELAGRAEGVPGVGELERTGAELGDATARDHAFEDRATGVEELGVEDVVVRAEGRRAREGEITRGIEGDRRGGAQVGEDQVAEALLIHVTVTTVGAVEDGRIAGERDRAREVTGHLDTAGLEGVATRAGGDVGRQVETRAVEDDVLAVGDRVDRGAGAGDRIDQAEDALVDDDVARDGVAALQDEITRAELDEARGGDLRVDRGGLAGLDVNETRAGAGGAEEQLHRISALLRGAVGRRADHGAAVEEQAARNDRQGVARDVRLEVRVRAERIDAGIVGRTEGLGRRDIHGRRTRREVGGGEGAGRGDEVRVFDLAESEGRAARALEGLETGAKAHRVVADVGVGVGVDDPHRGQTAVDDARAVRGEAVERDRRGGDQAFEERRIAGRNTQGVGARGIEQQRAVGGTGQSPDAERGAAGIGLDQGDLGTLGDDDVADGLDGLQRGRAVEAERTAVEVDAGGIGPAALPSRDLTPLVVDDDLAARTQDEAVRVGAGGGVEEGSRAVIAERVRIELQGAEDLDRTRAQRRGASRSRAGVERHGHALGDQRTARVVVRVADRDVAHGAGLPAAEPVVALETETDAGGAGQDVIRTAEDERRGTRAAREAVGIARADAEGRGEVVDFRVEQALEDRAAITDGAQVEGGVPHRTGERERDAVGAAEVGGRQDGRGEVAIEHDGAQRVELAERAERGFGVEAAVRGEAEARAGVDAHVGGAQGRTRGGRDLHHALLDIDAAGEGAAGVAGDDQVLPVFQRTRAELDEVTAAGEGAGEFHATTGTSLRGINDGVVAEDRRRAADLQAVAEDGGVRRSGERLGRLGRRAGVLIDRDRSGRKNRGDEGTRGDVRAADRHADIPTSRARDAGDGILAGRPVRITQRQGHDRAGAGDGEGLVGEIEVTDLDGVTHRQEERIAVAVEVDRGRAADVERQAVAGLAAEDDVSAGHAGVGLQAERAAVDVDDRLGRRAEATEGERRLGDDGTPPQIGAARERVVAGIRRIGHRGGKRQGAVARLGETGGARTGTEDVDDATREEGVAGSVQAQFAIGAGAAVADDARRTIRGAVQGTGDQGGAVEVEHGAATEVDRRDHVHQARRSIDLQGTVLDVDAYGLRVAEDGGVALQEQGTATELGEIGREDATAHRGGATGVDQAFGRGGRAGRVTRDHRAAGTRLERSGADDESIAAGRNNRGAGRNPGASDEHAGDEAGGTAGRKGDRGATGGRGDDAGERDRAARVEEDRSADGRGAVGEQAAHAAGSRERADAGDAQERAVTRGDVRVGPDAVGRRGGRKRLTEAEVGDARREDGADGRDRTRDIIRLDAVGAVAGNEVRDAVAGDGDDRRGQDAVRQGGSDGGVRARHADVGGRDADAVRRRSEAEREAGGDIKDQRAVGACRTVEGQRGQGSLTAGEAAEQHVGSALVGEGAVGQTAESHRRGRGGRQLERAGIEVRRAGGGGREGVGAAGEEERALVEAEERVIGEAVERQRAVAGLAEGVGGRSDVGQRVGARQEQRLAGGDVDRARGSRRAVGEGAVGREAVGDAQDARVRAEREAGEAGAEGDGTVGDRIAEVGVGRDADLAAIDREAGEAVVAAEDEAAVTGLRETGAGEVTRGVLGHRRSRADRDGRSRVEDGEVVRDGDIAVEGGERAAVEHHMGSGRERSRAVDVEHAGVDLREAGVGVRALEVDDAAAGLDEVVEAAAGAVLDDAGEDDAGVGVVLGERAGRAGRSGVGAAGEADRTGEVEVGVSAAVRVEGGVAEHHDIVRETEILRGAVITEVEVRTERAAVEDELAGTERAGVTDFEDDALVEREVAAEGVPRVQEDETAAVGRGDGLRLDGIAENTDLDGARAHQHRAVDVEHAVAAEAVGVARAYPEGGRGVDRRLIVEAGLDARTEEELTVGGSGEEVQRGAVARHVDTEDAFGHRGRAGPGDGRESADVFEGEDAEGGAVRLDGDATGAGGVRGSDAEESAGIDGDRARTEGLVGGGTGRADEREDGAFVDGDRLGVIRIERAEGKRVGAPLLDRAEAGDRAVDIGDGVGVVITAEGDRAVDGQGVEIEGRVAGRADDDRRAEVVVRVRIDRELVVSGGVAADDGVGIDHHLRLVVQLALGVDLGAVEDVLVALAVGVRRAAAERIRIVQAEPVVAADDHVARQGAAVVATDEHVDRTGLGQAARGDLAVEKETTVGAVVRAIQEEFAAVRHGHREGRSLVRVVERVDQATSAEGEREGRGQRNARTGHVGVVVDLEGGAIGDLRDDGVGRDAGARDRLTDDEGRGIRTSDGVGAGGQITGHGGAGDGRQRRIQAHGVDDRIVRKRTAGRPDRGRAKREAGGDAGALRRVGDLIITDGGLSQKRQQAEGSTLIAQEGVIGDVDHPRRGHAGGGAGAGKRQTGVRERRGRDAQAVEAESGVERASRRSIDEEHAAVGAADDVRHFQDGRAGVITIDRQGARTEADGDRADLFVGIEIVGAREPERSAVERDARGVSPTTLVTRAGVEAGVRAGVVIVERDRRALAEADDVRVGSGRSVDRRAEVAREDKAGTLTDFDDPRAERRGAGFGAAGGDVEIGATIDDRSAGVVVGIEDVDVARGIARDGLTPGIQGNRHADFEDLGRAGEHVVLTGEPKRAARADAVTVARARGERAEELDAARERVAEAVGAERLPAVADRAQVEVAGERRDGDPQRAAEGRRHRGGRERAARRGEIAVERQDAEIAEIAEDGDAGGAAHAADAGQTQDRTRIDDDRTGTKRGAGSRGDLDRAAGEDVRAAGIGIGGAGDAQRAGAGLGDREGVGADGVLDDAGKLEDGTAGTGCAGRDVEDRGVATGDRAHEADILGVGRRRGSERRITEGEVAELEVLLGETIAEDTVVIGADRRGGTVDHDGDAAGGGALRADDGGEAGTETGGLDRQQAALEFEGRGVGTERERRVEDDRAGTQDEAGLGVDVGDRVAGRELAEAEGGRAALDDLDRSRAVEEITGEGGAVDADHDERARRGRGVGDATCRARQGADLDRTAVEVDRTRVVEDEVDRGRLGHARAELDRAGLDGDVGGDPVRAAQQQGARAELGEDVGRDRAGKGRGAAAVTAAGVDHAFVIEKAVVGGQAVIDATEEDVGADDRCGRAGTVEEDATQARGSRTVRDDLQGAAGDVGGGLQRIDGASPGNRLGGRDHADVGRKLAGKGRGGGRRGGRLQSVGGVGGDEIGITCELAIRGTDDDRRQDAIEHRGSDGDTEDIRGSDEAGALGRSRHAT